MLMFDYTLKEHTVLSFQGPEDDDDDDKRVVYLRGGHNNWLAQAEGCARLLFADAKNDSAVNDRCYTTLRIIYIHILVYL